MKNPENILNSYIGITEQNGITAVCDVSETLNLRSGDVDETMNIMFFSKNMMNIGFAKVVSSGDHTFLKGDFHGSRLAKVFGFAPANA